MASWTQEDNSLSYIRQVGTFSESQRHEKSIMREEFIPFPGNELAHRETIPKKQKLHYRQRAYKNIYL